MRTDDREPEEESHEFRSRRLGECAHLAFDPEARAVLCRKDMREQLCAALKPDLSGYPPRACVLEEGHAGPCCGTVGATT